MNSVNTSRKAIEALSQWNLNCAEVCRRSGHKAGADTHTETAEVLIALRDALDEAQKERAHQQGRATRNAEQYASEQERSSRLYAQCATLREQLAASRIEPLRMAHAAAGALPDHERFITERFLSGLLGSGFGTQAPTVALVETPDPALVDRLACVIASAIWRPQPCMSGNIWDRLGAIQRRHSEDAAISVLGEIETYQGRVRAAGTAICS